MGYDHAEQKEINPVPGSSRSSNGTEPGTQTPVDPEMQTWAASMPKAETHSSSESKEGEDGKTHHTLGKLKLRAAEDDLPTDWWFASTAIPLISSTFLPLANLLSIAGLVVYWRNNVTDFETPSMRESTSVGYADPRWCTLSLI